jgi:hypothetical protein
MTEELKLTFQRYDGSLERVTVVLSDDFIGETAEILQLLLGLPSQPPCRLGISRSGKILENTSTFRSADIQQGDQLTLIPFNLAQDWEKEHSSRSNIAESLEKKEDTYQVKSGISSLKEGNEYQLVLKDRDDQEVCRYSVKLGESHENNPLGFFEMPHGKEYQNFANFLQDEPLIEAQDSTVNKILKQWCIDISQGYRTFSYRL